MNSGTRDEVEGKMRRAKGEIKETAGELTDNPELEIEGRRDKRAGKIQEKVGQIKKVVEE